MNIQNMIKQAQKMQLDMSKIKEEIDKKIFPGKYLGVEVEVNGKKEILRINIDKNLTLNKEDIEVLEDMVMVAINNTFKLVDKEIEEKLGKVSGGLSSLF